MIFHISIPAKEPERVAKVIAELWGGEAFPFLPMAGNGSWVAFAGDDRGSGIECYPRGATISPSREERPAGFTVRVDEAVAAAKGEDAGRIVTHAAVYSPLALAENAVMLEVLTEELKAEYLATQTLEAWRAGAAAMARKQPPS